MRKLLHKLVVHPVLHIDAVGAHAGLARIAVLAGHGAFYGAVDVGIVKHDEGRVAAQFEGNFLHRGCALRRELLAEFQTKVARLDAELTRRESELQSVQESLKKVERTLPIARQRSKDFKDLLDKNFVSKHLYMER